jgi:hypothetical protein
VDGRRFEIDHPRARAPRGPGEPRHGAGRRPLTSTSVHADGVSAGQLRDSPREEFMVEGKGFVCRAPRCLAQKRASEWTSPTLPCPTLPTMRNRRNLAQPREAGAGGPPGGPIEAHGSHGASWYSCAGHPPASLPLPPNARGPDRENFAAPRAKEPAQRPRIGAVGRPPGAARARGRKTSVGGGRVPPAAQGRCGRPSAAMLAHAAVRIRRLGAPCRPACPTSRSR